MNKTIVAIIVVVIVVLGGYFLLKGPSAPSSNLPSSTVSQETQPTSPAQTNQAPLPGSNGQVPSGPEPQVQNSQNENVITYTDSGYSPSTLRVKIGETVTFKNESSKSMWPASAFHPTHTVYSGTSLDEHCPDTAGTAFDACKGFLPGSSWSFKFTKAGTWKYHDHLNPGATGTIVVE
jgi:plastocyanin